MLGLATFAVSTLSLAAAQLSPYAPTVVDCPTKFNNFLRQAEGLSPNETAWLSGKDRVTQELVADFLSDSGLQNFTAEDAQRLVENSTIRIGIAVSGGSYRAMLTGAGVVSALDSRTKTNTTNSTGSLAGLLQASTYLSGLSGGSWLVSSLIGNDFPSVQELQESTDQWEFSNLFMPGNLSKQETVEWFETLAQHIYEKRLSGFNTSLTDLWGLGLGAQLLPADGTDYGSNITLSGVAELSSFQNYSMPFPILVADHADTVNSSIGLTNTVLEFTPFEIGSWDPTLYSFAQTKYVGSTASNGTVSQCVNGLDNLAFSLGTSASLFNLPGYGTVGHIVSSALPVQPDVSEFDEFDLNIAVWNPNPFNGTQGSANLTSPELLLVDGGENGEGIPLQPLIQPAREVDIVFAVDSASDRQGFPDGSALIATFERQFTEQGNNTKFPYVPTAKQFVSEGLLDRPTFFGINAANLSSLWSPDVPEPDRKLPPVIVYLPNSPYTFASNVSTLDIEFPNKVRDGLISNGAAIVTQNGTVSDWRPCVACAIMVREQQRRGEEPSEQCKACFNTYAWPPVNGTSSS